jgi:hypothetical protein
MADMYVLLDSVQFRKNYFQNRNKIRTIDGWHWLTVPVNNTFGQSIKDVLIDPNNKRWKKKYWDSIFFSYKKAPYFDRYTNPIRPIFEEGWTHISELNSALILKFLEFLGMRTKVIKSSTLNVKGNASSLILNICQEVGATLYISGISGKDYLNIKDFEKAGIEIVFQEFHHPIYNQLYEPFIPCMSILDLLFNQGDRSLDIINGIGVKVVDEIFL